MQIVLTPEIMLAAYAQGLFPMAQHADSPYVHWFCPQKRAILPIQSMHIPRRLRKTVRQMKIAGRSYDIRINAAFDSVVTACATPTQEREDTWINPQIIDVFCALHRLGQAHSVECWQEDTLVGGLYGLAMGGAFFGESMFSRTRDASKAALVHLAARLYHAGYTLLDTQFSNPHLEQFGVREISHEDYVVRLNGALQQDCTFGFNDMRETELVTAYFSMQAAHHSFSGEDGEDSSEPLSSDSSS